MLTPVLVQEVLRVCRFQDGEPQSQRLEVVGVLHQFVFHRGRLQSKADVIAKLLWELPVQFRGSGDLFTAAYKDRHGRQWTGEHWVMEQLFALGLAIGKVRFFEPRELAEALSGGVPVFIIER